MNILIFSTDYKPKSGGIAEYTHQVAKHFKKMNHSVVVLSVSMPGGKEFDNEQNIITYRIWDIHYLRNLCLLFTLIKLIKRHNIEYVFSTITHPCGEIAWLISRFINVKTIITVHGYEVTYPFNTFRQKLKHSFKYIRTYIYNHIDVLFAISKFTKDMLVISGVNPSKIFIFNNGVDLNEWNKTDPNKEKEIEKIHNLKDKKVIITVSNLGERKGHDMVLKALPEVLKIIPNLIYLIGGTGPTRKPLESLVKSLNLKDLVKFLGYIPKEDLSSYYHLSDMFIMPNREVGTSVEGFGIVFIEANACKKPVIAGRSGGALDAVVDGKTGLLVNPEDRSDIAKALIKLLNNVKLTNQMGEIGYNRVKNELTWERIVSKMADNLNDSYSQSKSYV